MSAIKRDDRYPLLIPIGQRIKDYRINKNMTQIEFAEAMGVNPKNLSKIENGERGISETMLYNLYQRFSDFDAKEILVGE